MRKILSFSDFIVCFLLALAFTAAPYYINNGYCSVTLGYVFTSLATFALFLLAAYAARAFLQSRRWEETDAPCGILSSFEKILSGKHAVLFIAAIILIFWAVPIFFLYPGTLINDTWGQLQQFIRLIGGTVGALSDHHPVFDTLFMGAIIVPLAQLTGNWHVAIFAYVLLQALLTALAFADTVVYVYKKLGLGRRAALFLLLIYCILPVFPVMVQTVSKDALHSWGFVFFTICFTELVRTKGEAIKDKRFLAKFTAVTLFCCLTKKVGFYVVLLSIAAVFIFQKVSRKRLLVPIACSVLLMNVVMPVVMDRYQVSPGGKQEMFSLPFQMTARYVKYYGDDITEDEYAVIDKVLTMETLADRYDPTFADPVKDYYQKGEDKDYIEYIKVWIKQGLRHPGVYISAFNSMLAGWFTWYEYAPVMNNDWRDQLDTTLIPDRAAERGFSAGTANAYQEMYHNLYNIPVLNLFLSNGFYASVLPAFAACTVLRKRKETETKYWLAVLPILFALVLGCWLAPVSWQLEGKRYLYPVVYTAPLMMAWCACIYKNNRICPPEEQTVKSV